MKVLISNVIRIRDYTDEVVSWCNDHLIVFNPEYEKKLRMNLWIGNTPERLFLFSQVGQDLVLPFGVIKHLTDFLPEGTDCASDFPEPVIVDYGDKPIPLYDYQNKAVEGLYAAKLGILQAPAGSGKTQIGIGLIKKYCRRTLWLTHTVDLLNQSMQRAKQYIKADTIGTITDGKINLGTGVTFATVQTMARIDLSQFIDYWDVIIVDECHRCGGTPTKMTLFYKVINSLKARHKFGLSATVHRSDGLIKAVYSLLGDIAHVITDNEVGDKIQRAGIYPINTGTGPSVRFLNTDGTINHARLINYLTEDSKRNKLIAETIEPNRPSLILSDRLDHLKALMALLPEKMKKKAVMVSGSMISISQRKEREQIIAEMREGKKLYLFATYSLAKEGLDIPRLERLYLTTPHQDYAVIAQAIGRVSRSYENKKDPVIYDFIDPITYLIRFYSRRCTTYKKCGCYFVKELKNAY